MSYQSLYDCMIYILHRIANITNGIYPLKHLTNRKCKENRVRKCISPRLTNEQSLEGQSIKKDKWD